MKYFDVQYFNNRALAERCNIHPKLPKMKSDLPTIQYLNYRNIKNGDVVYVVTSALSDFTRRILPKIRAKNSSIILVLGASDVGFPNELSKKGEIHKTAVEDILQCKLIKHIFVQNCDISIFEGTNYNKITKIPLGLDYHYLVSLGIGGISKMGKYMKAEDQEKELLEIADSDIKRETKIGVDFYHAMYKRHDNDREKAWQVFKKMKETKDGEDKLIKIYETKTIRKKYWEWMRGLKFIASPFGNGLDCHRTYEALMLGCIPIVRDYNPTSKGLNPLRELYKDLPVHFVNEWDEIYEMDEEQLNEIYDKADFSKVKERLTLDYWWKQIDNKQKEIQKQELKDFDYDYEDPNDLEFSNQINVLESKSAVSISVDLDPNGYTDGAIQRLHQQMSKFKSSGIMILTDKDDYERHLKKQYQNVNIVKVKDVRKAFPHITQVKAFLYNIGQRLIRDQEYDYVVVCDLGRSGMGLDFNKCFTNGDKWKAISGVGIKPDGTKVYNDTFNLRCVGHRFNEKELQFSLMKRGCTEKEAEEIAQDKYEVSDLEQMEVESAYHGGTYIGAGTSTLGAYFPGTDASETAQRAMGCPDSEHVGFHNSIRVREPDFRIGIVSDIMSGV